MAPCHLPLLSLTRLLPSSSKNTFKSHSHTNRKKIGCSTSLNCAFLKSMICNCPTEREREREIIKERELLVMVCSGGVTLVQGDLEGGSHDSERLSQFPFLPPFPPGMRHSRRQWKKCRQTELRSRWKHGPLAYAMTQLRTRLVDCLFTHLINYHLKTLFTLFIIHAFTMPCITALSIYLSICLSVCLSVCLSIDLFVCLSIIKKVICIEWHTDRQIDR